MNDQNENDLWYVMTQQRLAKLGLDVGVEYAGMGSEMEASLFTFSCPERYKHDIVQFVHEAAEREELTDDIIGAFKNAWPEWRPDQDDFVAEMTRLSEIADAVDAELPLVVV